MSNMEKTFFYNFFPSKAEEEALKATNSTHQVTRTLVEINSVYPPPVIDFNNPWQIRKQLTNFDVVTCKLVISFVDAFRHVFRYWTMPMANHVAVLMKRLMVILWDVTDRFPKRYQSNDVYFEMVHNDDYAISCPGLFRDRGLKVGDEIEIFWDPRASTFQFRVLHRAAAA